MHWFTHPTKTLNESIRQAAQQRQVQLTKPPGSLGRLETLAIDLAAMQGVLQPQLEHVHIIVFAGDHGITEEQVSAYPQAVTAQMVENFANGGAAISVLAQELGARLEVVDVAVNARASLSPMVRMKRVINGTANFARHEALTNQTLEQALAIGRDMVEEAANAGMQLFIGGEMGIGNTTSASALAASLLELNVEKLTGAGTGLDAKGISHKSLVIEQALYLHRESAVTAFDKLRCFGGGEIAALVGAYIHCAQLGIPMLIDGFISSVAALYAQAMNKGTRDWMIFSHRSQEPGHQHVLSAMQGEPLLDLQMRLGEGSGAAIAMGLLRQAVALHNKMATFAEAGVSEGTSV